MLVGLPAARVATAESIHDAGEPARKVQQAAADYERMEEGHASGFVKPRAKKAKK